MDYKPYTVEWSRKRYLSEAIQKYFEDDVPTNLVIGDIVDILEEWSFTYKKEASKLDAVLLSLKKL